MTRTPSSPGNWATRKSRLESRPRESGHDACSNRRQPSLAHQQAVEEYENVHVPHNPHPQNGMTQFCRAGAPGQPAAPPHQTASGRSSAASPSIRPGSRESVSDVSQPTSMSSADPSSGAHSPVKPMYASNSGSLPRQQQSLGSVTVIQPAPVPDMAPTTGGDVPDQAENRLLHQPLQTSEASTTRNSRTAMHPIGAGDASGSYSESGRDGSSGREWREAEGGQFSSPSPQGSGTEVPPRPPAGRHGCVHRAVEAPAAPPRGRAVDPMLTVPP